MNSTKVKEAPKERQRSAKGASKERQSSVEGAPKECQRSALLVLIKNLMSPKRAKGSTNTVKRNTQESLKEH